MLSLLTSNPYSVQSSSQRLELHLLFRTISSFLLQASVRFLSMEVISRALLVARDDKSFWEKYKWLIIGGAIAIPIQVVAGLF
jgi:hypothetical protein